MSEISSYGLALQFSRSFFIFLCLSPSFVAIAGGHTIQGRIVGVHDGDSVTLLDATNRQYKVRLDGIDAPELGQTFGRASKASLSRLTFRREAIAKCGKVDRYRREVCSLHVAGTDAGLAQVEAGMAWYFRRYEKELTAERRQANEQAEKQARDNRKGLWIEVSPVAPWDWRAAKRRGHVLTGV